MRHEREDAHLDDLRWLMGLLVEPIGPVLGLGVTERVCALLDPAIRMVPTSEVVPILAPYLTTYGISVPLAAEPAAQVDWLVSYLADRLADLSLSRPQAARWALAMHEQGLRLTDLAFFAQHARWLVEG